MRPGRLIVSSFTVLLLVLAGCGEGAETAAPEAADTPPEPADAATEAADTETESTEDVGATEDTESAEGTDAAAADLSVIDCPNIEVIVPYSPGGGSDQQVRRLQPTLEEVLDKRLNITYQTGGDGSVGWNALANSEPNGCTIANVVAPNIMNLSLTAGEEIGFSAEEFEYIGWTEYSPNIIGVAMDSEWETFEDYVAAAEAAPGEITISGVGVNGELLASEVINATGLELTFVPVSGGVGDIIPQIAGGHIDSAISGFSLLEGEQIRPLVLSAPSDECYPDLPTFEEAGYPGVTLVTSWGFILPPETPQEIVEAWNAALQQTMSDPAVQEAYADTCFTVLNQDVQETQDYFQEQFDATQAALEGMEG